jgi:hypothetical protein
MPCVLKEARAPADIKAGREYRLVTFLLFLASVGLLEYLLRDVRQNSDGMPASRDIKNNDGYEQSVSNEPSTPDLLSLGQALEGAQKTPDSEHASEESAVR